MQNIPEQDDNVQNINDLNLSYLLLAQSLIKEDKEAARFRLGLTESLMDSLRNLSVPQLIKLASTNQLICQLRINSEAVIDFLTKDSRIDALQHVHTGIILSTDLLHTLPAAESVK
ncbi:flagellar transcriptional activator FlhD [Pantoea latae]|jgi:flagellar transcriptional activator FlhD|uniref:Flagellar transcriptional regulator FlhD n=1 Tax=Pantoea latae TaxID=1964541 RepID=A0A1V9DNV3_9GAMM|nr:flagellar transcriptional regulator FlhD [Pantoea latae]OQP35434.1 flagellar transcriptional activator FlhD [Pantoea latae]